MYKVKIIEIKTGEVGCKTLRSANNTSIGMGINLNHKEFYVDISKEEENE